MEIKENKWKSKKWIKQYGDPIYGTLNTLKKIPYSNVK